VPGYIDVITQPMDFGTMTEKVAKSKYRSLDESYGLPHSLSKDLNQRFQDDLHLVISNTTTFNSIPQGLYTIQKPNESKHGYLTTSPKRLPASSNMRPTGTSMSTVMKMSTSMPLKTPPEDGGALDLTHPRKRAVLRTPPMEV